MTYCVRVRLTCPNVYATIYTTKKQFCSPGCTATVCMVRIPYLGEVLLVFQ